MDNYLSHRWPGAQPAPVPQPAPEPKKRKKRRLWQNLLVAVLAVLVLGGAAAAGFWGVQRAADYVTRWAEGNNPSESPGPGHSTKPSLPWGEETGDWTPAELPSAQLDPSVQLELNAAAGPVLTAREIYGKVIPSMVLVEVKTADGYSVGSGFFISESGYLITNYHVVDGGLDLAVMLLSDRTTYDAFLVGYDEELDLAVLKAEGGTFTPVEIGDSDTLEVGDTVYAIGNPMGYLYGTMTDGIVSAVTDRVEELDYPGRLILTSAQLNSGNSGGPMVDAAGRVVGINSAKITGVHDDVVVEGLGLAIPISDAKPYLDRILRTGKTARPSIGISCYNVEADGVAGVLVKEVTAGTPAEGLIRENDLIYGANGVMAGNVDDLTRIFAVLDPGDTVDLMVLRNGERITVTVVLYDRLTFEAGSK